MLVPWVELADGQQVIRPASGGWSAQAEIVQYSRFPAEIIRGKNFAVSQATNSYVLRQEKKCQRPMQIRLILR